MAQTVAHRDDHVIPPVPMRQWVISVPKRLRGILADRPQAVTALARMFLEEIERLLCHAADVPTESDAAGQARPRLGAVSFQHRFGSALNQHVHLHACVTDGVFERSAAGGGVTFDAARLALAVQRLSVVPGSGSRPKLVRYTLPRHKRGNWVGPGRRRKSTQSGASVVIELTPFEFLDRLAVLIPPPRRHRHRYHGVSAPNHPLRSVVTAFAIGNLRKQRNAKTGEHDDVSATAGSGCCGSAAPVDGKHCHHDTSRIAWVNLLARLEEKFPLACPRCGGDIRLISFITDPGPIRKILSYLGEPLDPPRVSPARGPPVDWGEQVQSFGARAFEQPSPDDQPMIDIHHRSLPVPCPSRLLDRLQIEADSEAVCADDRILRTSRSFPPLFLTFTRRVKARLTLKRTPKPTVRSFPTGETLAKEPLTVLFFDSQRIALLRSAVVL